jgi:hypothetical protein
MESQRKPLREQWAPWIEDPDEVEPPMSDEELEAFGEGVSALLKKKREEDKKKP